MPLILTFEVLMPIVVLPTESHPSMRAISRAMASAFLSDLPAAEIADLEDASR
jgi:hypothetical protein